MSLYNYISIYLSISQVSADKYQHLFPESVNRFGSPDLPDDLPADLDNEVDRLDNPEEQEEDSTQVDAVNDIGVYRIYQKNCVFPLTIISIWLAPQTTHV